MASKSKMNHDDEAASSVELGFLPSALGSSTTGVPIQRVASPVEQDEVPARNERSDTVSAQPSRGRVRGTHSLASRIQKPPRSRSALEVLQASQVHAPDKKTGVKPQSINESNVQTQQPVRAATVHDILLDVFGTFELRTVYRIENLQVNKALWASHHARAVESGDVALCVATRTMRHALEDNSGNPIRACRIRVKKVEYAVWVNVDTSSVLCVLSPADVYLMGWVMDV